MNYARGLLYKESADYGVTWDSDVVVDQKADYNTMVSIDGAHVDVIATGHPTSSHYQVLLAQSADTGATWTPDVDLSNNDTADSYFLPDMVRDGSDLHVIANSSIGAKYFHSGNGGATWDPVYTLPGCSFIAYTGCTLHVIYVSSKNIYYIQNPTGNAGHCTSTGENQLSVVSNQWSVYPNPSHGKFTIESSVASGQWSVEVYDVFGEQIYSNYQIIKWICPQILPVSIFTAFLKTIKL